MLLLEPLRQRSALSGLGAVLFASGVVLLFVALYKDAADTAWSPLPIVALCVLAAAVVCWIAAAQGEALPNSAFNDLGWSPGLELPESVALRANEFRQPGDRARVMARQTSKSVGWNRPLAYPLTLRDGTDIATLRQAAALLMGLSETWKSKPVWQRAAHLVMQAQKSGKPADIRAATDQLRRALQLERWM